LAHITGGGLPGNIARVLPTGTAALIEKSRWRRAPIFEELGLMAGIDESEMYRTFNMGIGFVAVTSPDDASTTTRLIEAEGHTCWQIGRIVDGDRTVEID
jgi:phosphoribosylformylglycinamidine cyclo-ligase